MAQPNLHRLRLHGFALIFLLAGQMVLSAAIRDVKPTRGILPDLISERAAEAVSFGDEQFLYRYLALTLQNAGDNGGRVTPLGNYDYAKVVSWLELLEGLDGRSHWVISMANGYFGQTPKTEDVRPIVQFMQAHVAKAPERKWPWLVNGVYLSRHRLKDDWLALDAAYQLSTYDYGVMNPMSLQMPALVLDDLGQYSRAIVEMNALRDRRKGRFKPEEELWMDDFTAAARAKIP